MNIDNIKVQDEKIIIITEEQILKALGVSSKKYVLSDVIYSGNARIIIKVKSTDNYNKSISMDMCEIKTLDNFVKDE